MLADHVHDTCFKYLTIVGGQGTVVDGLGYFKQTEGEWVVVEKSWMWPNQTAERMTFKVVKFA
jgi:hypothetical protein